MPPPIIISVAFSSRFSRISILSETFAPPIMATNGFSAWCKYFFRTLYFRFHQQAKHFFIAGKEFCNHRGGSMCPVCGTKCIIHIYISQCRQFFCKSFIAFFFFFIKTKIFQQQILLRVSACLAVIFACSPIQSLAKKTVTPPSSSDKCFTRCFSEYLSVGPSFGRRDATSG